MIFTDLFKAETSQEANQLLSEYLQLAHQANLSKSTDELLQIVKSNLAYYAGYEDSAMRERIERLYDCEHPVFGKYSELGDPTPEEAFALGGIMGGGEKITLKQLRGLEALPDGTYYTTFEEINTR